MSVHAEGARKLHVRLLSDAQTNRRYRQYIWCDRYSCRRIEDNRSARYLAVERAQARSSAELSHGCSSVPSLLMLPVMVPSAAT